MNKKELGKEISKKAGISVKMADETIKAFTEIIASHLLAGDKISISGFGTFEVQSRSARKARNPRTGEMAEVSARRVPKFKSGKALKDLVK